MGFIENYRIECLRSVLINTHLIEAAYNAGAERYFYSSSACVYNTTLQQDPHVRALKESDAYPAMAERGYGWEKLISEMFCQEYWAERQMKTFMARFHNAYGPFGTWDGGREKASAALARKVIAAEDTSGSVGMKRAIIREARSEHGGCKRPNRRGDTAVAHGRADGVPGVCRPR